MTRLQIEIQPVKIIRPIIIIAVILIELNLLSAVLKHRAGQPSVFGLVPMFDFDSERNVPTLFSSWLLLTNAMLFLCTWILQGRRAERRGCWLFLAVLFFFLALDEFAALHERLILPVRNALQTSGVFYFAWVIPYGLAAALVVILVLPALRRMIPRLRLLFMASGAIYLAGAVGLEMAGGKYYEMIGYRRTLRYALLTTVEESLEMAGLILLIYAVASFVQHNFGEIHISGDSIKSGLSIKADLSQR